MNDLQLWELRPKSKGDGTWLYIFKFDVDQSSSRGGCGSYSMDSHNMQIDKTGEEEPTITGAGFIHKGFSLVLPFL